MLLIFQIQQMAKRIKKLLKSLLKFALLIEIGNFLFEKNNHTGHSYKIMFFNLLNVIIYNKNPNIVKHLKYVTYLQRCQQNLH